MPIILHLMPAARWQQSAEDTHVTNSSLGEEGFIHCTDAPSVMLQVANAFYREQSGDFVVLHIEAAALTSPCVWEAPAHVVPLEADGGPASEKNGITFARSFPHVYGPIDRRAIRAVQRVTRDESGAFTGYGGLDPSV